MKDGSIVRWTYGERGNHGVGWKDGKIGKHGERGREREKKSLSTLDLFAYCRDAKICDLKTTCFVTQLKSNVFITYDNSNW